MSHLFFFLLFLHQLFLSVNFAVWAQPRRALFSPEGSNIVCTGSEDGRIHIWDTANPHFSCEMPQGKRRELLLYFPLRVVVFVVNTWDCEAFVPCTQCCCCPLSPYFVFVFHSTNLNFHPTPCLPASLNPQCHPCSIAPAPAPVAVYGAGARWRLCCAGDGGDTDCSPLGPASRASTPPRALVTAEEEKGGKEGRGEIKTHKNTDTQTHRHIDTCRHDLTVHFASLLFGVWYCAFRPTTGTKSHRLPLPVHRTTCSSALIVKVSSRCGSKCFTVLARLAGPLSFSLLSYNTSPLHAPASFSRVNGSHPSKA